MQTIFLTSHLQAPIRFNKIAIQETPQMAADEDAIILSRVYSYSNSKCTLPLY